MKRPLSIVLPVAAVVLAACGAEREQQALTIERSAEPAVEDTQIEQSVAAGEAVRPAPAEPGSAAGRAMDSEQLAAALPTVQELPSGWSQEQVDQSDDNVEDDVVTPAQCEAVFDALDRDEIESVADATAEFAQGPLGPFLTVTISSYDSEVDVTRFERAVEALAGCPEFSVTDSEGTADFSVSPLSFSNPGDSTLALRYDAAADGMEFVLDQVLVIVGANVVSLTGAGFDTIDAADLESIAATTVGRLAEVA